MHTIQNQGSKIYTSGTFFPEQIVKSDDLFDEIQSEARYDIPKTWIYLAEGSISPRR